MTKPVLPGSLSEQFVYFLLDESSGAVKIGKSQDPRRRWACIQSCHPATLRPLFYVRGEEREYHRRFASYHLRGEWFEYRGLLERFCESTLKAGGGKAGGLLEPVRHPCNRCGVEVADNKWTCMACRLFISRKRTARLAGRSDRLPAEAV